MYVLESVKKNLPAIARALFGEEGIVKDIEVDVAKVNYDNS